MAYPEKILADDEKVVEHMHPHWITLVPATLWFILFCGIGGAGIALSSKLDGTAHSVVLILIIVVALGFIGKLTVAPWVTRFSSHYIFTTHRVLIRRGVLKHTGRDISLQRISDVGFTRTLWDRLVGAGSLTIESAGEHGQETLVNVPHSDVAQQTLNRLVEEDGLRRARQAQPGYSAGSFPNAGYQQAPPAGYQQPPAGYQPSGYLPPTPDYQPPAPSYQQYPPTSPYPPQ